MRTIITIQHTQSVHHTNGMVGSWTDWELSELGVEQANRIGERLKAELSEKKFVMYSSDLLRAKQTAEIVGQYLGLIPILRTELRERNLGKCCMPLFEMAVQEYGKDIFAFYYDLPFEETLRRHETKPNKADFGEQDMRRWWKENDFIHIIPEKILTKNLSVSDTVDMIYNLVS